MRKRICKKRGRKKLMRIGLHSKYVTGDGYHHINHGVTANAYNRSSKRFRKLKNARKYAKSLVLKYRNRFRIEYKEMMD
jgi:hypothetical protein